MAREPRPACVVAVLQPLRSRTRPKRPELALLTGGFVALSMAALVVIYWIGSIPIDFWLLTSGERVVMSIVVCCGALLPLLVTEAVDGLPPTRASPTARVGAGAA